MVITSSPLPKKEAGRLNTLVNFQPIFTLLNGQFSADDNNLIHARIITQISASCLIFQDFMWSIGPKIGPLKEPFVRIPVMVTAESGIVTAFVNSKGCAVLSID